MKKFFIIFIIVLFFNIVFAGMANVNKTLMRQPPNKINGILGSLVNSTPYKCTNPRNGTFKGWNQGSGYWSIECNEGNYTIFMREDGNSNISKNN